MTAVHNERSYRQSVLDGLACGRPYTSRDGAWRIERRPAHGVHFYVISFQGVELARCVSVLFISTHLLEHCGPALSDLTEETG